MMLADAMVTPLDPEPALVRRALAGERSAWDALVLRHRRAVLVALLAQGLTLSAAEEVCQEAWSRLWSQQQRGGLSRLELPGLAVTQARFIARDGYRRDRLAAAIPAATDVAPDVEETVSSRQSLERVAAALLALPARDQRLFRLAQQDGVPHAQLAEQFGLSVQRVRQIVFEVRTRLRAALEAP